MAEYKDRERFIPFQKSEIVTMLCEEGTLGNKDQDRFRMFCKILESIYHFEFHSKLETLKENYLPLNPDRDTMMVRGYSDQDIKECEDSLTEKFKEILNNANYEEVTEKDLAYAVEKESLFNISLFIDFDDFESQLIFRRGVKQKKISFRKWFFKKQEADIPVFERVAMLVKFKDEAYFETKKRKDLKFAPGTMIIKLFKNIPKADIEMLFPNSQVRMRLKDILLMGGTAIGGGVAVFLKAGAGLLAMISVFWFMTRSFVQTGGEMPRLGPAEISGMVGGAGALAAIGAFLVKQWNSYKNRKIQFMKTLGDNLYFKNMDNNAGVFHHVIDDAEEEECKEAILAYYFMLKSENGLAETDLDDIIEQWLEKTHNVLVDFEIKDALRKLKELELCMTSESEKGQELYKAVPLDDACKQLDYIWDNYFQFNV